MEIRVSKVNRKLRVVERGGYGENVLMEADIVSGCEQSATPSGTYSAGKWIRDKTNPVHGSTAWSKDPWSNPYGPYFMPLHDAKTKKYSTYGIHGTRGPLFGNFEKPPLPETVLKWFIGEDSARYLYCSHGCIRLSSQNINKLFELTTKPYLGGADIKVVVE